MKALVAVLLLTGTAFTSTNDIHQINFRNFAYRPACLKLEASPAEVECWQLSGTGQSVKTKNGEYRDDSPLGFRVLSVAYGTLAGESNEVAVVMTICNTGGSGDFSEGFLYGMVSGKPTLRAVIAGGDRANGGIHSATIAGGLIQVERYGTDGGACCPEWIDTINYKLDGHNLVQVGQSHRRKYVAKD